MDSRVKHLWIDALESGDYKQGREALRNGDSFCCLGVLCDLYLKDTGMGEWQPTSEPDRTNFYSGKMIEPDCDCGRCEIWADESETELPSAVAKWAGISQDGTFPEPDASLEYNSLIGFNDNGYDFSKIAQIIREKF